MSAREYLGIKGGCEEIIRALQRISTTGIFRG